MTTGATGQLGLALPVQGELSGTWGDTVNNGITQYTNIAIAGTLTLTGDGAVTLANTTGDASASNITSTLAGAGTVTAQFAIVKVSGTTTTKVVTGPSYSKTYVVDNASSFAVTFKASGQTGVSVAAAEKVTVVFNGTDYIKLAGTIANAAGSNTQIQFNNGGLFGASANLTWDGTTLSSTQVNITGQGTLRLQDTTGGEYVGLRSPSALGASYTLTFPADDGTSGQALITDGSGGLSWSTAASGDVYGPASATDNALARFDGTTGKIIKDSAGLTYDGTNLVVANGDITIGTNGKKLFVNYIANNSGTDLYIGSSNTIFTIAATEAMRLNSTGLGIGTNSPGAKLDVNGTIRAQISGGGTGRYVDIGSDGLGTTRFFNNYAGGGDFGFIWRIGASDRMTLDSAGNLGIGTSSPATKLDVVGTIRSSVATGNSAININNSSLTGKSWDFVPNTSSGESDLLWYYGGTSAGTRMTLSNAGNLGIGTTSPAYKLDVNGEINLADNQALRGAGQLLMRRNATSHEIRIGSGDASDYLAFYSGAALTATLDSAGNLGLGVTPSAWNTSNGEKVFQFDNCSLYANTGNDLYLNSNWFLNSSAQSIYLENDFATSYSQQQGNHVWYTAPSGTAGNVVSFTQAMTLDSYSRLGIGTTSIVANLTVGGGASAPTLALTTTGPSPGAAIKFLGVTSAYKNWQIGATFTTTAGALEFTPSTTDGGSTFTTPAMTLNSSGNLGVGTTSPTNFAGYTTLEVKGPSEGGRIIANYNNSVYMTIFTNSNSVGYVGTTSAHPAVFLTSGSERMRITDAGNVGIGTSSPAYKLDVVGTGSIISATRNDTNRADMIVTNSGGTVAFGINNSTGSWLTNGLPYYGYILGPTSSSYGLQFGVGASNTAALTISPTGNAGLGVTPSATSSGVKSFELQAVGSGLVSFGSVDTVVTAGAFYSSTGWKYAVSGSAVSKYYQSAGKHQWFNAPSGTAGNAISFTQAMTLDAAGNLLVGTTSAVSGFGSAKIQLVGRTGFVAVSNDTAPYECGAFWHQATTGDNTFAIFGNETTYTARGSITYNRSAGLVAYNTTSDYRAKDITGPVTNSGTLIDSVPVYIGKMKGATQERPMFIAHETPVYAHTGVKDAVDADGNPVYQQMDASALIPVMWAEIQSLRKRLADAGI